MILYIRFFFSHLFSSSSHWRNLFVADFDQVKLMCLKTEKHTGRYTTNIFRINYEIYIYIFFALVYERLNMCGSTNSYGHCA